LYVIGAKNLIVEVDAKYIKRMLNEPELQPNAVINRWIQGILLFDFTLVHVPATQFKGPDALSHRPLEDQAKIESYDDSWLDHITLFYADYGPTLHKKNGLGQATSECTEVYVLSAKKSQEAVLTQVYEYLMNPNPESVTNKFLRKVTKYFVRAGHLFKRTNSGHPLLVIFDKDKRAQLLNQAHELLGHHRKKATWENLRHRFYWPQIYQDV